MRQRFADWGTELSEADFACALAALGTLRSDESSLRDRFGDFSRPLAWMLPDPKLLPWPDAQTLVGAWQDLVNGGGLGQARLAVLPRSVPQEIDFLWIVTQLSRPEVGAASVYAGLYSQTAEVDWNWPLTLGFLDDPASLALRWELNEQRWREELYTLRELDAAHPDCDLLVIPGDLRTAARAVLGAPRGLQADAVIVLGSSADSTAEVHTLAHTLVTLARSGGVVLARLDDEAEQAGWVQSLMAELAHDNPLDVAVARASTNREWPRLPLLFADLRLIEVARVSNRTELVIDRLRRFRSRPTHSSYDLQIPETITKSASPGDLERGLRELRALEEARSEKAPPRFLQARLQDPLDPKPVLGALRPETTYQVEVRIGFQDDEWKAVAAPFPTLEEPPEPEGHRLTVIFWEPRVSPEPQVETLWLPPEGSSQPCRFLFHTRDVNSIVARVTVLHRNRVLQTGLLRAWVRGRRLTFELDATPRARLEGLSNRSRFDLALVLNHDDEGTARLTAASDDQAVVLALDDGPVAQLTQLLDQQISAIARDPDRYVGLESPGSVELLRSLAQIGATVYDALSKHTHLLRLADAGRIHITSAKAESFLPVELLYRFRPPAETAGLCPHAAAALEAGDCLGTCPSDKRQTVCPLGFWGLSRVIERHAHRPEDQDRIRKDFDLRAEPVRERSLLPLSTTSLLAASDRASGEKKDTVSDLFGKLQARGPSALASTWAEWEQHVASDLPGLLVLLPHHERNSGFEILAIGEDERLASANIWEEVVRKAPDGPQPIVLLMGCETNLTRISFDNPVSRFRDQGAALVVSTIATVLGRHASPAAALLVELLDQMAAPGDRTFGDVMLRLRQKLVATQTPMALGLTAYGDADWVLTKG
jgi:hypothetical protein